MSSNRNTLAAIFVVGTLLLVVSLIGILVFPTVYEIKLEKETTLVNNTMLYNMWVDVPLPIYQKLYFFNITNAEHFRKHGGVLEVVEVGPFVYKSQWNKKNIQYQENGTVSYQEGKTFHFVLEESISDQNTVIYTLNGPLIMAADFLKDKVTALRKSADIFFKFVGENLITQKTVAELVFDGYDDPILRVGQYMSDDVPYQNGKFSWLYGRNGTDDGTFEVYTGQFDHDMVNKIYQWNGNSFLNYWKGDACNKINGTNGEFGPPIKPHQTTYTFFQPIFCRSIAFDYSKDFINKGILTKRFVNHRKIFANSLENPDNSCFESGHDHYKSGILNISSCQFGAPVFLSFPHFYLGDDSYLDNIVGLNPKEAKHNSYIDVEPQTGVTVDLAIRFQLNLKISRVPKLSEFSKVDPGIYPVFWAEISAEVTQELSDFMEKRLHSPKVATYAVLGVLLVLSLILVSGSFIELFILKRHASKDPAYKPLLREGTKCRYSSIPPETDTLNKNSASNQYITQIPQDKVQSKIAVEAVAEIRKSSIIMNVAASGSESKMVDSQNRKNERM